LPRDFFDPTPEQPNLILINPATLRKGEELIESCGWHSCSMSRGQQPVIQYLIEENRVLGEQIRNRRTRLPDDQRGRLAAKAKKIAEILAQVAKIVTPETLLPWHRKLIARSTTVVHTECPDPRGLRLTFPAWSFGWPKKTAAGIIGGFKVR